MFDDARTQPVVGSAAIEPWREAAAAAAAAATHKLLATSTTRCANADAVCPVGEARRGDVVAAPAPGG
jgi:hypothetical protein